MEQLTCKVGPYTLLKPLGQGGMGEVFLAWDPFCQRHIALKRIRHKLLSHAITRRRFLKEAQITSRLLHPGIIPIYSVHEEKEEIYYLMPYVEGATLKEKLLQWRHQSVDHLPLEASVLSLLRLFVQVCQAVAYAHSQGFLHRDLKPENIMLGKYGQVFILDWGLVERLEEAYEEGAISEWRHGWTHPHKPVGTLAYMAPERVLGASASIQSDIYALGVLLYQLLTFKLPFKRISILESRKIIGTEEWRNPLEAAPYRDIAPPLVKMMERCLALKVADRYPTVDALLEEVENYLEGRSSWYFAAQLRLNNHEDWQFLATILLPQELAIIRQWQTTQWAELSISRAAFSGNVRLQTRVKIGTIGGGVGLLLSTPGYHIRGFPADGFCLWLAANESGGSTHLLRSTAQVVERPDISLERHRWYELCFDQLEDRIQLYIDGHLRLTYVSPLPVNGSHVGLLYRDHDFEMQDLQVLMGSLHTKVSCLAVADAFLANRLFDKALLEYRRVALAFAGRQQAHQALFRLGMTWTEYAASLPEEEKQEAIQSACEAFEKLRSTPHAPLEYLGKALLYERLQLEEEESKCFALALRRYAGHPDLALLEEQILFRMQCCAKKDRVSACRLALLLLQRGPSAMWASHPKVFSLFATNLEPLPFSFLEEGGGGGWAPLILQLGFWLAQPYTIAEIMEEVKTEPALVAQGILILWLLQAEHLAAEKMALLEDPTPFLRAQEAVAQENFFIKELPVPLELYLFNRAIDQGVPIYEKTFSYERQIKRDFFFLWSALWHHQWEVVKQLLAEYPEDEVQKESHPFYFLVGCYHLAVKGEKEGKKYFDSILDRAYPRSWVIGAHHLFDRSFDRHHWLLNSFFWEKQMAGRQLALFSHCTRIIHGFTL